MFVQVSSLEIPFPRYFYFWRILIFFRFFFIGTEKNFLLIYNIVEIYKIGIQIFNSGLIG